LGKLEIIETKYDDHKDAANIVNQWFDGNGRQPFDFQVQAWKAYLDGKSGLIHAATGIGKTYAVWMAPIIEWLAEHRYQSTPKRRPKRVSCKPQSRGATDPFQILWLTPLRALARDTLEALMKPLDELKIPWAVEIRTGDTPTSLRTKQRKRMPTALITTPETLSILLSYPDSQKQFLNLRAVVVDEWHELMGSKRGVLTQLSLARVRKWNPTVKIWGLSATLGNISVAMETLLGSAAQKGILIEGLTPKSIRIETLIPDKIDRFPWAGHMGLKMLPRVIDVIEKSKSVLVFTNTRSQTEIWYQAILEARSDWAGRIALHHGSLDKINRQIVENDLRDGKLKCVVCTSSLDLGVDFSPVDRVMQIGSPKGVARLIQRAGRSGHRPGQISHLIYVPTNALELIEVAAARKAISDRTIEPRQPVYSPLDVLTQHMVTIAMGDSFSADALFDEVKTTHAFKDLTQKEFKWALDFVTGGGPALTAYPEYSRVILKKRKYTIANKTIAQRHRMNIGTITSDASMMVRHLNGRKLGTIEESFIARLKRGDHFVFAGHVLEYLRTKDMTVYVRKSQNRKGSVPQWLGGRMPLSTRLSAAVRRQLTMIRTGKYESPEAAAIKPILDLQEKWSAIPKESELLIERTHTREGEHFFIYPFEGRLVHEGLAALFASRITRKKPITISLSVNDYGMELLSDQKLPIMNAISNGLMSTIDLDHDILDCLNTSEMAKRQFREIARVAGLVFQGFPGRPKTGGQLQASSALLFNVFQRYDPDNLLLKQAVKEVLERQLESHRLTRTLKRLSSCDIRFVDTAYPTPLAFPLMVNRLRARISSEKLADRIKKMQTALEKAADRKSKGKGVRCRKSANHGT
jgi:ATP-dependent Lhr-like helicase